MHRGRTVAIAIIGDLRASKKILSKIREKTKIEAQLESFDPNAVYRSPRLDPGPAEVARPLSITFVQSQDERRNITPIPLCV